MDAPQKPLGAQDAEIPSASIDISSNFHFNQADGHLNPKSKKGLLNVADSSPPPLGVLSNFTGEFSGAGFNMIFRPNSGPPNGTTFPITPAGNPIPQPPNENVLELNLTAETLNFSNSLGDVPNRGLELQQDIHLNGVPYVQVINDVTNLKTGKGDSPTPIPIHFEPGLWMHVPATDNDPSLGESLVRMASIPHGTTINAETLQTISVAGPPQFAAVDITPFPIGLPQQGNTVPPGTFRAQTATNLDTPRIPQDLTKFIAEGTITQEILSDPNTVLRNAIKGQTITNTIVFEVSTAPAAPGGGGVANIAFLQGAPVGTAGAAQTGPNANAAQMSAIFWIETVQYQLVVPPFKPGAYQQPLLLSPAAPNPNVKLPVFSVNPPTEIKAPKTITVTTTQIQYSQFVFLNFAGLTWPHVSVATLVPSAPQVVPASAFH